MEILVLAYDGKAAICRECPDCHAQAYTLTRSDLVRKATAQQAGERLSVHYCASCKRAEVVAAS